MNILVIRMSSIGDVVLTTPVLRELRNAFPTARIDFLVLDKFSDAITDNENIDNILIFEKEKYKGISGIKKYASKVEQKYDVIVDLHSKARSILITKYLKPKKVFKYKKRSFITNMLVRLKIKPFHAKQTIVENYFDAFKDDEEFGNIKFKDELLDFNYSVKDKKQLEEKIDIKENYIVVAPGASKPTKKWLSGYWSELIVKLYEKYNTKIYIVGGKNEIQEQEEIKARAIKDIHLKELKKDIIILSGKTSLKETAVLMESAMFCVANDSGPFHMSRAMRTKTFVIFGPTDPKQFTYNKDTILIYNNQKCSACTFYGGDKCPKGHFKCMKDIKPTEVFEIITKNI